MTTDKKLRTAVVGAGYLGTFHAEKYATLEASELVAVVDTDAERAKEVAKKAGTEALTSYKELFGKVDAVSIVTPTESHYEIGLEFIKRGTHVLIEKPITVTTAEADSLVAEAEKAGVVLQVGHLERFNPAVVALKDRLTNPVFIESHRLSPFPYRSLDVDVVLDLMIHDIDIILNLVRSEVTSVDAAGIPVISRKVDIANARLKFENGCVANVTASRVSKETQRRMRIFQPATYMAIDFAAQHISISRLASTDGEPRVENEELDIQRKDSLLEEIRSFLECSASGTPPLVSGSDGKRALEVAARIQTSVSESIAAMQKTLAAGAKPVAKPEAK